MSAPREIRTELARVGLAWIGIAAPFAIGCALGDRSRDVPLEPRYAWVIGAACLVSLAVLSQSVEGRARQICAALAIAPALHALFSGSPMAAALDITVLLASALVLAARAALRIARAPRVSRARRGAALTLLILFAPGPHFTLAWGLVSTTLAPGATRLFHFSPEIGEGERAVSFTSQDGLVIRGTYARGRDGAPAVLLVHGLADSRRRLVPWARELTSRGAHTLRIDLRAHGTSDGVVVTFADREQDDVEAALRFLAAQPGVGALHVLGVSMGGGAALAAVSRRTIPVASTVGLAPATDFHALVDAHLPPVPPLHWLASTLVIGVTHGLGNRAPLELVPADAIVAAGPTPILIVHSRSDRTVPASITESLARRAPWIDVCWIDGVSHVELPEHTLETRELRERIAAFLGL